MRMVTVRTLRYSNCMHGLSRCAVKKASKISRDSGSQLRSLISAVVTGSHTITLSTPLDHYSSAGNCSAIRSRTRRAAGFPLLFHAAHALYLLFRAKNCSAKSGCIPRITDLCRTYNWCSSLPNIDREPCRTPPQLTTSHIRPSSTLMVTVKTHHHSPLARARRSHQLVKSVA